MKDAPFCIRSSALAELVSEGLLFVADWRTFFGSFRASSIMPF
jgi:hypothetical protein